MNAPLYTIILAAGKGTRMKSAQLPKVCFEVNGVPAIVRAMRSYRESGVLQFIVVVGGQLAGKVISTVSAEFPNVVYTYQPEQDGTAGAVDCALKGLTTIGDSDDILVVAGDRLIDRAILEQFYYTYYSARADFALLALELHEPSSAGHILSDKHGTPMAIIEMADIRQRRAYFKLREAVESGVRDNATLFEILCASFFPPEAVHDPVKGRKAFGELWVLLAGTLAGTNENSDPHSAEALIGAGKCDFTFETPDGPVSFSADEAEASPLRNNSIYLVKRGVLVNALKSFTRDNAQREIYLSDILNAVYRQGLADGPKTAILTVSNRSQILGFNNPSELLEVERLLSETGGTRRPPHEPGLLLPLSRWRELFAEAAIPGTRFHTLLLSIYGDKEVIARQSAEMRRLGDEAAARFKPDTPLMFVRAPGRLNAMGRHVDHQGGNCNLMTISYETMMFAAERADDLVSLSHCDSDNFPAASFKLGELLSELPWEDWDTVINSKILANRIKEKGVQWTDYIRAAILRIQKKYKKFPLAGMDILVSGNIPMAAGLSSSSSLMVCAMEILVRMNGLDTFPNQFVTLCGESEWFVGTHGGSSDHAAVKLGGCGSITKVRFFDFGIEETVPFPDGYCMLVCDSGVKARKSSNAKDQFNHRVACYRMGFALIRKYCPQYAAVLHHLRDVNTTTLHVPLREIYKMLLMLPDNPTRTELEHILPSDVQEQCFSGHDSRPDRRYPIRGVVLYGLSEMQRAAELADVLKARDLSRIGQMMAASHDGDRVVSHDALWHESPFHPQINNNYIMELLDDLESGDVARVTHAQLDRQCGAYGCSVPEIDLMVDIAARTPGVVGAQLAGAGLGGCMMILTARDAIPELTRNLKQFYYDKSRKGGRILVCRPVAGAGALKIDWPPAPQKHL